MRKKEIEYLRATARALAGAIIFAFPLLMTMEMWWLGFYMERYRLAIFLAVSLPMLTGLSYYAGFEEAFDLRDEVMDALTAFAVGFVASAAMLSLLGELHSSMGLGEIVGKIAVQTIPASIGAMVARKQLGGDSEEERKKAQAGYFGTLFLMAAGALFVAFNVAPTDEMILISYQMTPWHALALAFASLLVLHAFVYAIGFHGQEERDVDSFPILLLRYTVTGYAIALLVSLYVLWTFGRTDGVAFPQIAMTTVVLAFPAALGAATARLVI